MTVSMCMTCEPMETAVVAGDALVLADDEQVGHAVERLQEIGEQIGERKADDIVGKRCRWSGFAA